MRSPSSFLGVVALVVALSTSFVAAAPSPGYNSVPAVNGQATKDPFLYTLSADWTYPNGTTGQVYLCLDATPDQMKQPSGNVINLIMQDTANRNCRLSALYDATQLGRYNNIEIFGFGERNNYYFPASDANRRLGTCSAFGKGSAEPNADIASALHGFYDDPNVLRGCWNGDVRRVNTFSQLKNDPNYPGRVSGLLSDGFNRHLAIMNNAVFTAVGDATTNDPSPFFLSDNPADVLRTWTLDPWVERD